MLLTVFHIALLIVAECIFFFSILLLRYELTCGLSNILERPYLTLGKEKAPQPCSEFMSRVEPETHWPWLLQLLKLFQTVH